MQGESKSKQPEELYTVKLKKNGTVESLEIDVWDGSTYRYNPSTHNWDHWKKFGYGTRDAQGNIDESGDAKLEILPPEATSVDTFTYEVRDNDGNQRCESVLITISSDLIEASEKVAKMPGRPQSPIIDRELKKFETNVHAAKASLNKIQEEFVKSQKAELKKSQDEGTEEKRKYRP